MARGKAHESPSPAPHRAPSPTSTKGGRILPASASGYPSDCDCAPRAQSPAPGGSRTLAVAQGSLNRTGHPLDSFQPSC